MEEKVRSVGIDIGTSTTQLVLSMLTVKNVAPGSLVPKMEITDKEILYRSNIHMTPIGQDELVDGDPLYALIRDEFKTAGITPEEIETGAVIITGETAKKENARIISDRVASFAGDFVVATAGGKLESIIAGKGSGAADYSRTNHCTVANIDIGGGTANIGVFKNGEAIDSCCINVGGGLLHLTAGTGDVLFISRPMERILAAVGMSLAQGDRAEMADLVHICNLMGKVIIAGLEEKQPHGLTAELLMTAPLRLDYEIDRIMVSGGVADYVYDAHDSCGKLSYISKYGDIGPLLGCCLQRIFKEGGRRLIRPAETIRATVIGAGSQTMDVSGSTIMVDEKLLPFKNMPVVVVAGDVGSYSDTSIGAAIKRAIENSFEEDSTEHPAIGLRGCGYLSFAAIQNLARGIIAGAKKITRSGNPLVLVLERDIGKVLGQSLRAFGVETPIICIDQLVVQEGDFIDIGRAMAGGSVVPVVIKSLVFETQQR